MDIKEAVKIKSEPHSNHSIEEHTQAELVLVKLGK